MKVVIPSRKRAKTIAQHSLRLFPDAVVCVEESEMADYAPVCQNLLPHPPLASLARIRNWIIENVEDEMFVMADDDVVSLWAMVGKNGNRLREVGAINQVIENAAEAARGLGARLFGFSQSGDVKAFKPQDPISVSAWVGTVFGVIGKDLKYDPAFSLHDDMDFSLQHLLKNRVVFRDNRFYFESYNRLRSVGGNTAFRSAERELLERRLLIQKWGKCVRFGKRVGIRGGGVATTTAVNVRRRQQ